MTYVIESFYVDLENFTYVRTFKDLKLRYDQHKEKLSDPINRARMNNDPRYEGISLFILNNLNGIAVLLRFFGFYFDVKII